MNSLLDEPMVDASPPAERLRTVTAATRVSVSWFGTRKTLTPDQKSAAAEPFGAEERFLSASKRLLDTKHPAFQAVTKAKNDAVAYWKSQTLPYPEPAVRLIRQEQIEDFDLRMRQYREELDEAAATLDRSFEELKQTAAQRLGRLYNPADYPASLYGCFEIDWDYPSVEPPSYLQALNPVLYEQECQRVASRFDEAVRLAEETFIAELTELVSHLTERLTGQQDGRPKVFRDSAVENLREFFQRFQRLNIRSSEQLDALVEEAQRIVQGVEPQSLREDKSLRRTVAQELAQVQNVLDELLVDRPRRNILRRPR